MCPLHTIDSEEYEAYREERLNRVIREKVAAKSKLPKQFKKEDLSNKLAV